MMTKRKPIIPSGYDPRKLRGPIRKWTNINLSASSQSNHRTPKALVGTAKEKYRAAYSLLRYQISDIEDYDLDRLLIENSFVSEIYKAARKSLYAARK